MLESEIITMMCQTLAYADRNRQSPLHGRAINDPKIYRSHIIRLVYCHVDLRVDDVFIEKPSFTIQMHPVHKLFGLVMIFAVIVHLSFNVCVLASYLKKKAVAIYRGLLVVVLMLLYSVAINNTVPEEIAIPMDKLAAKAEPLE